MYFKKLSLVVLYHILLQASFQTRPSLPSPFLCLFSMILHTNVDGFIINFLSAVWPRFSLAPLHPFPVLSLSLAISTKVYFYNAFGRVQTILMPNTQTGHPKRRHFHRPFVLLLIFHSILSLCPTSISSSSFSLSSGVPIHLSLCSSRNSHHLLPLMSESLYNHTTRRIIKVCQTNFHYNNIHYNILFCLIFQLKYEQIILLEATLFNKKTLPVQTKYT